MSGYEIKEKDIDTVLKILKRSDPEKLEDMLVDLQKNSEVYHELLSSEHTW